MRNEFSAEIPGTPAATGAPTQKRRRKPFAIIAAAVLIVAAAYWWSSRARSDQGELNTGAENGLTNALNKGVAVKAKKVYFVQGNGEHDLTSTNPEGYSEIVASLTNDNFETDRLVLAQTGSVPTDASVVVVAGPNTDLPPPEVDALRTYLRKGGTVHLLINPPEKDGSADLTNLVALAKEWGVNVGKDIVVDASGLGQLVGVDASVPVAMPVKHPITDNFRVMSAFPLARSVTPIDDGTSEHIALKVLETSPQSWAESDIAGLYATGKPKRDTDKGDIAGPVSIAVAVSTTATGGLVVVGDSDFATNRAIEIQGNREIFLRMTNWLVQHGK